MLYTMALHITLLYGLYTGINLEMTLEMIVLDSLDMVWLYGIILKRLGNIIKLWLGKTNNNPIVPNEIKYNDIVYCDPADIARRPVF